MTAAHCAFHPEAAAGCHLCGLAAQPPALDPEPVKSPERYCPTCARQRGNGEQHPDGCVCAEAGVELAPTVHVPGGQRDALARLAARADYLGPRRSVMPLGERSRILEELRAVGPRVPVEVEVERTDSGWRVEAGPRGQLALGGAQPQRFVAELPACGCDARIACTAPRCTKTRGRDGHCHGRGEVHVEHVEAFVRKVARTYRGRVTVGPIPR